MTHEPRARTYLGGSSEDRLPLHELVDRWRSLHGAIEEPCICGGPDIRAASGSSEDVAAAVRQHQIEPVHIAFDEAHGIPLAAWQRAARAVDLVGAR